MPMDRAPVGYSGQTIVHLEEVEPILEIQAIILGLEAILALASLLCFVTTVRNQATQRIDVTSFMDTHPIQIQGSKREKAQVLQQMSVPLI